MYLCTHIRSNNYKSRFTYRITIDARRLKVEFIPSDLLAQKTKQDRDTNFNLTYSSSLLLNTSTYFILFYCIAFMSWEIFLQKASTGVWPKVLNEEHRRKALPCQPRDDVGEVNRTEHL